MFFLLRTAFWFGVVILLMPAPEGADAAKNAAQARATLKGAGESATKAALTWCVTHAGTCLNGVEALEKVTGSATRPTKPARPAVDPTITGSVPRRRG